MSRAQKIFFFFFFFLVWIHQANKKQRILKQIVPLYWLLMQKREGYLTFLISCHMSLAVMPWESPEIKKQGHSETWTPSVSCAAIAKVTGGWSFTALKIYILRFRDNQTSNYNISRIEYMFELMYAESKLSSRVNGENYLWCKSTPCTPSFALVGVK